MHILDCGHRPSQTQSVWKKPWSLPLTDGPLLWCNQTTPHLDSTKRRRKEEGAQRSQFNEWWLMALSHHILCLYVHLPPVPWRSGWRSLWPGRDDRHADDSGSSWPQSPPSHEAGHPEESHKLFSLCIHVTNIVYTLIYKTNEHVSLCFCLVCSDFLPLIFNCSIIAVYRPNIPNEINYFKKIIL